jgi:hypothetical protein
VLGALLSFLLNYYNQQHQTRLQRKIAAMQIASNLRFWMGEVAWRIDQTKLSDDSNGHDGAQHTEIPDFPFEASLERVSQLKPVMAKKLFDLLHAKETGNRLVKWSIELNTYFDNDGFDSPFRGLSAQLFLDAAALYKCISEQLGWSEDPDLDHDKTNMKSEVERFEQIQADLAATFRACAGFAVASKDKIDACP